MAIRVQRVADPGQVLDVAATFLESSPVLNNVVLTLLRARRVQPEAGRYWIVDQGPTIHGVAFQSPLSYEATMTPMPPAAARALAEVMAAEDPALPGVNGVAATAAIVAGQWAELTKRPAVPWQGQRVYRAEAIQEPQGVSGGFRLAEAADRDLLVDWVQAFHDEATPGEPGRPEATVDHRLPAGHMWVWDDHGTARSMCTLTPPVARVVRVQAVYTPTEHRGRGYGGALVAGVSHRILADAHTPALYSDLGNPVSNSVYRRVGYECVAEVVRYRLG